MKRKTIFNTLVLTLMVLGSLFVANLSPHMKVSADSIPVVLIENNKYKDAKGNYYEQAIAGVSADSKIDPYTMPSSPTTTLTRGDTLYFKYEPIVWQVLDYDSTNNRALVVSNKILANVPYQPTWSGDWEDAFTTANGGTGETGKTLANNYTYSNIRYWLNGYTQSAPTGDDTDYLKTNYNITSRTLNYGSSFYGTAFSSNEQSKILATTGLGKNDATTYVSGTFNDNTDSNTSQPITGADKIFLLSYKDCSTYYSVSFSMTGSDINEKAQKAVTDYAASQGTGAYYSDDYVANTGTGYNGTWMTRSDASMGTFVCCVYSTGSSQFISMTDIRRGIAPAMYLDTTGLTFYSDFTCATTTTTAAAKTYVKFGSYPQTVADCTTNINVPPTGVSINTAGVVLSGTILLGLTTGFGIWLISKRKQKARR